jgi:hypothetical protein
MLEAVESLPVVRAIVTVPWLYPLLSALHVLGIGLLFGAIVTVDLRLLGVLAPAFDPVLPTLLRIAIGGFVVVAVTGMALASVRLATYAANPAFLLKQTLILAAGTNALVLRLGGRGSPITRLAGRRRARLAAFVSLSLWTGAIFAGRWIAFV